MPATSCWSGDAAHTAHFSIGSGTKLAMEDSIALVDSLRRHQDLQTALTRYEMERQPVVERFQEAAAESSTYFEEVSRYESFAPLQFAFNLLTRSRRISYGNLSQRDPLLVRSVDSAFAAVAAGAATPARSASHRHRCSSASPARLAATKPGGGLDPGCRARHQPPDRRQS